MDTSILALCIFTLLVIAALPRVFFRPGQLNARWWLTAAPFFAAGATVLAGLVGWVAPVRLPWAGAAWLPPLTSTVAAVLCAVSVGLIGYAVGTHTHPVSLWHQDHDTPDRLVTAGPYRWIRHPLYAAFLLTLAACVLAIPHPGTAVALAFGTLQLKRTAVREEMRLSASGHGSAYRAYMSRTGRFFPRLWQRTEAKSRLPT